MHTIPNDDFAECAREPIHTPGAIQPHGVVLVINCDLKITAASSNCEHLLMQKPSDLVNHSFSDLFGAEAKRELNNALVQWRLKQSSPVTFEIPIDSGRPPLDCRVHESGSNIVIDFERKFTHMESLRNSVMQSLQQLSQSAK